MGYYLRRFYKTVEGEVLVIPGRTIGAIGILFLFFLGFLNFSGHLGASSGSGHGS